MNKTEKLSALLDLSHQLGDPSLNMAILGEGNTSVRIDNESFLVKASGTCLMTLSDADLVECRFEQLLPMLERDEMTDEEIVEQLYVSRVDQKSPKPSVEALFHAYLLSIPGVEFVGHTHSVAVNQVLCSPQAEKFATHKLIPDEVVCCGSVSVFVPYTDPGLKLSQAIRVETEKFLQDYSAPPRVILLGNHGIITLGSTSSAVMSAMLMAQKAAEIFVGAATLGGPTFMPPKDVERIANRIDEHYRQKALKL